ncbi:MAG: hypothetical protein WD651_04720 [Acidimicrobiia bacterium]
MIVSVVGLNGVLLATPVIASVHDSSQNVVRLEVELPSQGLSFVDPSGLTLRVAVGEAVVLVFRVFDASNRDQAVDVEETLSLLEIRDVSLASPAVRLGDMERTARGVYRTTYDFRGPGRWMLVVQPDIVDRSSLPVGSTSQLILIVEEPASASVGEPVPISIVASAGLVLLLGVVVGMARRKPRSDSTPPKPPITQDTWWNSP